MKHIKNFRLFESAGLNEEQTQFLNKNFGDKWSINPSTGLIDVDRLDLAFERFTFDHSTPKGIRYGVFKGDFEFDNELTPLDLAGLPREVTRNFRFRCSKDIDSLKGLPDIVGRDVYIRGYNPLKSPGTCSIGSLEGLPKKIGGDFLFDGDKLDSLQGFHTNIEGAVSITIHQNESFGFKVHKGKAYLIGSVWYWVKLMLNKYGLYPKMREFNEAKANELIKLFSTLYTIDDFKRESEKNPQENPYLGLPDPTRFMNNFTKVVFLEMNNKEKESFLPFILNSLNMLIEKDPEGMMIKLSGVWNDPGFASIRKEIVIPSRYEEEMDTLGDLGELGF